MLTWIWRKGQRGFIFCEDRMSGGIGKGREMGGMKRGRPGIGM